jgi:hypothetical protein
VASRLHHHQDAWRRRARRRQGQVFATPCAGSRQQREQLLRALSVFLKCRGLNYNRFRLIDHRNVMYFGSHIDPRHHHA